MTTSCFPLSNEPTRISRFMLLFLLMVCNTRRSSLSSPAANLPVGTCPSVSALDLYVFLVADASDGSKLLLGCIGDLRCAEKPSEQEDERTLIHHSTTLS